MAKENGTIQSLQWSGTTNSNNVGGPFTANQELLWMNLRELSMGSTLLGVLYALHVTGVTTASSMPAEAAMYESKASEIHGSRFNNQDSTLLHTCYRSCDR
eukprot:3148151-Ditylum_brightwellii.AAC.1